MNSLHWVACWGNATSITDRKESVYAKDLTLRYPIHMCFDGNKIRLRFSNLTGTEGVTLTRVLVALKNKENYEPIPVFFSGKESATIAPGKEIESDDTTININAGDTIADTDAG